MCSCDEVCRVLVECFRYVFCCKFLSGKRCCSQCCINCYQCRQNCQRRCYFCCLDCCCCNLCDEIDILCCSRKPYVVNEINEYELNRICNHLQDCRHPDRDLQILFDKAVGVVSNIKDKTLLHNTTITIFNGNHVYIIKSGVGYYSIIVNFEQGRPEVVSSGFPEDIQCTKPASYT